MRRFTSSSPGATAWAPRADDPLVFTTHSTHKLLAAFSQASMIHVQDGGARQLDRDRFNEAFMMHISTSPQYSIIASLDVASAMMEGRPGLLLQEMFDEALSFRRALANLLVPSGGSPSGSRLRWLASTGSPRRRLLQPQDDWHGFGGDVADDYVLFDPIKVTLVMPGLNAGGAERAWDSRGGGEQIPLGARAGGGEDRAVLVPGPVLHGHHQGQVEHLAHRVTGIQAQLRRQYQPGQLPAIGGAQKVAATRAWVCDLCDQLHACYRSNATAKHLKRMYTVLPHIAMKPADAYDQLVRAKSSGFHRRLARAHRSRDAGALSARYSADHAGRALYRIDPIDHRLPGICPDLR
jgi:arginine decarboxylase